MQWSRLGLASIIATGLLGFATTASAEMGEYGYNDAAFTPIPAYVPAGGYRSCHSVRYHHHWRHYCRTHRPVYVCQMYTYEITPQHRDMACSKWRLEWRRVHHRWWHHRAEK